MDESNDIFLDLCVSFRSFNCVKVVLVNRFQGNKTNLRHWWSVVHKQSEKKNDCRLLQYHRCRKTHHKRSSIEL